MSPSQLQAETVSNHAVVPSNESSQLQQQFESIQLQPTVSQPMNPQRPHEESQVGLRGGDRGGMCPGRFCFCVPCPLPCDFCII
ncbi:hypothetical protein BX600DRAFT_451660 [Xylariales sp. PMI_506]|nr:hypothetical protein BX600DRAFT_451660 [Xylariales sp. PMI_506]